MMRLLCKAAACLLGALVAELGHSQEFSTITIRPAKSTDVRIQISSKLDDCQPSRSGWRLDSHEHLLPAPELYGPSSADD